MLWVVFSDVHYRGSVTDFNRHIANICILSFFLSFSYNRAVPLRISYESLDVFRVCSFTMFWGPIKPSVWPDVSLQMSYGLMGRFSDVAWFDGSFFFCMVRFKHHEKPLGHHLSRFTDQEVVFVFFAVEPFYRCDLDKARHMQLTVNNSILDPK